MRTLPLLLALSLLDLPLATRAQEAPPPTSPSTIVIKHKPNPGDVPYKPFYRIYGRLLSMMAMAPRMLDPVFQMSFSDITLAQQDGYLNESWNVAIVGDAVDIDIPTLRGGYYVLPAEAKAADVGATVMFNTSTRHNYIHVAWKLRLPEAQTLRYRDFSGALAEIAEFQAKVPWYSLELRVEKRAKYNGLKACFTDPGGAMLVDGKAAPTIASANCVVYQFDPQVAAADPEITLLGKVDIVVLEDTARYQQALAKTGDR